MENGMVTYAQGGVRGKYMQNKIVEIILKLEPYRLKPILVI